MMKPCKHTRSTPLRFRGRCYLGLSGVGLRPKWLRGLDLNQRPLGYEPNELPDCSTPQIQSINWPEGGSNRGSRPGASRIRYTGGSLLAPVS